MEVKEFQQKIVEFMKKWEKYSNCSNSEQSIFNHMVEEVGELARQFVNKKERKDKFSDREFNNAIGDILIHLVVLAHLRGIKIEKLINEIIEEDSKRFLK